MARSSGEAGDPRRKGVDSVTAVAGMSGAGMLRQHAHRRVSRADTSWEIPMTHENQARSPCERGPRRTVKRISWIFFPTNTDGARPALSAGVTWWRAVTATASGLMVKVFGLAAGGEAGSSGFLLAAASWFAAEVLECCAAYAQATYPIALKPPDRLDPADEHKSDIGDSRRAQIIVLRGDRRA